MAPISNANPMNDDTGSWLVGSVDISRSIDMSTLMRSGASLTM
jgi:hypothetical protein